MLLCKHKKIVPLANSIRLNIFLHILDRLQNLEKEEIITSNGF